MDASNYGNTPDDFCRADIAIAGANIVTGSSSNLAQLSLSYSYTFDDPIYDKFVSILSVVSQLAIDSAKKRPSIDLIKEMKYLRKKLNTSDVGVPKFWKGVIEGKGGVLSNGKINYEITCPMNVLGDVDVPRKERETSIPIGDFFVKHEYKSDKRKSKRVEEMIEKFSLGYMKQREAIRIGNEPVVEEETIVLRNDFEELVETLRRTYLSTSYTALVSWIIDRAFLITTNVKQQSSNIKSRTNKNKALLLKVLYEVSPKAFLACFVQNK